MEVTLKKVKTFQGREGYGLNADVYVNGVKCFFFMDDAGGGMPKHMPIYDKSLYQQLKDYAEKLPIKSYEESKELEFQPDIDTLVDEAYEKYLFNKANMKLLKYTIDHVVAVSGDGKYAKAPVGNIGINYLVKNAPHLVTDKIKKLKELYPTWKILNENIPAELLK